MKHRKEIDGLRALAVVPVILFHAGFPAFSGGFIGVDIFFVISGYLITSIIISEKETEKFSLLNFYERRVRRIIPALFFVMFCCLPFAWFWSLPLEMKDFSKSLIAVPLFASNILFFFTSGYFDPTSDLKPLLHTWSLAVEEQYYLLFPLLLISLWNLGKKWLIVIFSIIVFISLILASWLSTSNPSFAFFLLPSRLWEILIGALIAFYFYNKNQLTSKSQLASALGLFLIIYSLIVFDNRIPSPSLYTLVPILGAVLVISFATPETFVGKILSSKLFTGIGLISYSAYLWHQPFFAFAKQIISGPARNLLLIILVFASFICAYFTWKYVEMPCRNKEIIKGKKVFICAASLSLFFITLGFAGYFSDGFKGRFTDEEKRILAYSDQDFSENLRIKTCLLEPENTQLDFKKECQSEGEKNRILIWGDSHAAALFQGFKAYHKNIIQYTASSCPPAIKTKFISRPNCRGINDFVSEEVSRLKPEQIFLHANWHAYKIAQTNLGLIKTIESIKKSSPNSRIIILGSAPQWEPSLPIYMIRQKAFLDEEKYLTMPSFERLLKVDAELKNLAQENGLEFISIIENMCLENKCLAVINYDKKFELTSWDDGHLTQAGAIFLVKKLLKN